VSFEAKYRGMCGSCDGPIAVGQLIRSLYTDRGYEHVECPPEVPEIKREVCKKCFQEKAANRSCACD